jgi:hypothetical protein
MQTINDDDMSGFEKLHAGTIFATANIYNQPISSLDHLWQAYRSSTFNQIEKVVAFGQDQSVCMLVNTPKINRSLCYVFNIKDDLIDRSTSIRQGIMTWPALHIFRA